MHVWPDYDAYTGVLRQTAVTVYLKNTQLLGLAFARVTCYHNTEETLIKRRITLGDGKETVRRLTQHTRYTTLLRRGINVIDVDSTSQQRRVASGCVHDFVYLRVDVVSWVQSPLRHPVAVLTSPLPPPVTLSTW